RAARSACRSILRHRSPPTWMLGRVRRHPTHPDLTNPDLQTPTPTHPPLPPPPPPHPPRPPPAESSTERRLTLRDPLADLGVHTRQGLSRLVLRQVAEQVDGESGRDELVGISIRQSHVAGRGVGAERGRRYC